MTYPSSGGQWQPGDPSQYGSQPAALYSQVPNGGFPPPRKKKTGVVVGVAIAVVALVAGGLVYFLAIKNSNAPAAAKGSDTSVEAAHSLLNALKKGDVPGLVLELPPAENALLRDFTTQMTSELQRVGVIKQGVDPNKFGGMNIEGLKFDESKKIKVNDRLEINMLVDGKITMSSDKSSMPLNDKFVEEALDGGVLSSSQTETVDIGKAVERMGGPIRIATIKVNGKWYPSLFYTVADYALHAAKKEWPKTSIPAKGAGSAQDAVKQFLNAAADGDLRRVIELSPPGEMGALHDAGPVLLEAVGGKAEPTGVKINKLETDTRSVTGGTKVSIRELDLTAQGAQFRLVRKDGCYDATIQGKTEKLCPSELTAKLNQSGLHPRAVSAAAHMIEGVFTSGVGLVATEVDGRWYVSPGRSFFEIIVSGMRGLQTGDVELLMKVLQKK